MKFTIFGASGFVGSNLTEHLRGSGHEVFAPDRDVIPTPDMRLGHVIYAIGLTGDFRIRPFDTINAHVTELAKRMQKASYDSWLYLSSTRMYSGSDENVGEEDPIVAIPGQNGIYDISKLLGEALCLALNEPTVRIVRLSNIYGDNQSRHTFLGSLLEDVAAGHKIYIEEASQSSKDYISIADVVQLIEKIALVGQHQIYNLASGSSTSHQMLAEHLRQLTGLSVVFNEKASSRTYPKINIDRITEEFDFKPRMLLEDLGKLISNLNLFRNQ